MTKVYFISQDVNIHKFPNILLSLIGGQGGITAIFSDLGPSRREFLSDIRQLSVDSLSLFLLYNKQTYTVSTDTATTPIRRQETGHDAALPPHFARPPFPRRKNP
jgi:hypothetical protein